MSAYVDSVEKVGLIAGSESRRPFLRSSRRRQREFGAPPSLGHGQRARKLPTFYASAAPIRKFARGRHATVCARRRSLAHRRRSPICLSSDPTGRVRCQTGRERARNGRSRCRTEPVRPRRLRSGRARKPCRRRQPQCPSRVRSSGERPAPRRSQEERGPPLHRFATTGDGRACPDKRRSPASRSATRSK
jgi:hypothetical protein